MWGEMKYVLVLGYIVVVLIVGTLILVFTGVIPSDIPSVAAATSEGTRKIPLAAPKASAAQWDILTPEKVRSDKNDNGHVTK
jgi:hypothetical protein